MKMTVEIAAALLRDRIYEGARDMIAVDPNLTVHGPCAHTTA